MKTLLAATVAALIVFCTLAAHGEDKTPAKLKVLYITGGGYHNYEKLTPIITEGIKRHANVDIDVKWNLTPLTDKNLGEGYDAIIYNICFAKENDPDMIENALRVTREGKPTLMLHCSMHTFQKSDAWTECCGERTRVHDKFGPFTVEKVHRDHPAIIRFPEEWKTEGDELYQTIDFPDSSIALLKATSPQPDQSGKVSVVCWIHKYGKGQVFGTTLGHDEKTVAQDAYLNLLASGLLWACGKLDADGNPKPGYGPLK